jgi:AraC-like DNA-binding protein
MQRDILHTPSSFAGTAIAIQETLSHAGVDARAVLQEAGIDIAGLSDPEVRIPAENIETLTRLAVERSGDPCFGLMFAEHVHPTSYHALGMSLLFSDSLRAFLQRLVRYYALISTMEEISLTDVNGLARLSAKPRLDYSETTRRAHADGWAGVVLRFVRMMYKPGYSPVKVELAGAVPAGQLERYRAYFGAPVHFDAELNGIYFDPADLDARMPTANAELARQNDGVVVEFLSRYGKMDLVGLTQTRIIELLPSGECSREAVAAALNMSVRNFHMKLDQFGTSYQQLLDQTRQELSAQYLKRKKLSITEISYLLGFNDSSNFSRGLLPRACYQAPLRATRPPDTIFHSPSRPEAAATKCFCRLLHPSL